MSENCPVLPPHLLESFDPAKATVTELKAILLECNVEFPTHRAVKEDFVAIYRSKVAPNLDCQRAAFLAKAQARPSNAGIDYIDAGRIHSIKAMRLSQTQQSSINIISSSSSSSSAKRPSKAIKAGISSAVGNDQKHPQSLPAPPSSPQKLLRAVHKGDDAHEAANWTRSTLVVEIPSSKSSAVAEHCVSKIPKPVRASPLKEPDSAASTTAHSFSECQPFASLAAEPALSPIPRISHSFDAEDYNDLLEAYENSSPPVSDPPTHTSENQKDDDKENAEDDEELNACFSPDPRSPSLFRNGCSQRSSVGGSSSPLLTQTLRQRLKSQLLEKAKRLSESSCGSAAGGTDRLFLAEATAETEAEDEQQQQQQQQQKLSVPEVVGDLSELSPAIVAALGQTNGRKWLNCSLLTAYAFFLPFLAIMVIWYVEIGSNIGYCDSDLNIGSSESSVLNIVTVKDFIKSILPSCMACPPSAVCRESYLVECRGELFAVEEPRKFSAVEYYFSSACSEKSKLSSKTSSRHDSFGGPSIQVAEMGSTLERKMKSLVNDMIEAASPVIDSLLTTTLETIKVGHDRVNKMHGWVNNFVVTNAKRLKESAEPVAANPVARLGAVVISSCGMIGLLVRRWISARAARQAAHDAKLARDVAAEVLSKLRRSSRHVLEGEGGDAGTTRKRATRRVRVLQVRDLMFPQGGAAGTRMQRRESRGGDVVGNGHEALVAVDAARREKVWAAVREIVVSSKAVREVTVEGDEFWEYRG
ncbi:hypothetical protein HDU83_007809 [Entophlyctis luteolus]|nr:hypothetical protein HDU83_007809 [Entophlyctis luteolus]